MKLDHDKYLLARAELSEMLETLQLTSFESNPVQFFIRLESIREAALSYGFAAVAEITSVFEAAMQRAIQFGGTQSIIDSFTGILGDAIGCSQLRADVAQALLASVAVRMPTWTTS